MDKAETKHKRKIILIDGYGFVFRAYHSLPPLSRSDGVPIGAVYGFANMLMKLIAEHQEDYLAIILDAGAKTFRNEIYPEYKANRPPPPEDLIPQFPLIRLVGEAFNLPTIEQKGFEADDLIATYVRQAKENGDQVTIVSSDKDLMQLIDDDVAMYDAMKSKVIGQAEVIEKFGVTPDKVLDVLSLMGDSSDNVPGVPGIGPKTAAELINEFGTLENILANAARIKQNKRRETLIENRDKALLSKQLITLKNDVPIINDVASLKHSKIDINKLVTFLRQQGFNSLINRAEKIFGQADLLDVVELTSNEQVEKTKANLSQTLIKSKKDFTKWFKQVDGLEIKNIVLIQHIDKGGNFHSISLCINKCLAAHICLSNSDSIQASLFDNSDEEAVTIKWLFTELKKLFEDSSVLKLTYNAKPLVKVMLQQNIKIVALDDIMLMAYILNAGAINVGLSDIIHKYLDVLIAEQELKKFYELSDDKQLELGTNLTLLLANSYQIILNDLVNQKMLRFYERIEKPLLYVLARMELAGIKLDPQILKDLSSKFSKELIVLEQKIYQLAGEEFNIASPKQLGEVLFEKMGIKGGKKSKTGAYSTSFDILEDLMHQGYEIAELVFKFRQLAKLKSTYTDTLPKEIASDGRVHTTFQMGATSTGRLSSNDPNLQNIPIRTEEGNKIRAAFVARKGYKLISADYSQIELRLLAHVADIKSLKKAFVNNYDIHSATASDIFGIELDKVTPDLRRKAKTINFGIIYGISGFGLAKRLGIGREEASNFIKHYFKQYPGIHNYMENCRSYAKEHGFVSTIWGRKCFIKGINDKNPAIRQFSERAAINAPLQGSAADIIKKAMVNLDLEIINQGLDAKILLQVHDELLLEVRETDVEKATKLTKDIMEHVIDISVPTTVDVGVGDNWQEIH